jgi:hypothetical protein
MTREATVLTLGDIRLTSRRVDERRVSRKMRCVEILLSDKITGIRIIVLLDNMRSAINMASEHGGGGLSIAVR